MEISLLAEELEKQAEAVSALQQPVTEVPRISGHISGRVTSSVVHSVNEEGRSW